VKGKVDYVAGQDGILSEISEPCVETMEPIGGTGDSLTGVVSAFVESGMKPHEASKQAALVNRFMGFLASPTPGWSIKDFLPFVSTAIRHAKGSL